MNRRMGGAGQHRHDTDTIEVVGDIRDEYDLPEEGRRTYAERTAFVNGVAAASKVA